MKNAVRHGRTSNRRGKGRRLEVPPLPSGTGRADDAGPLEVNQEFRFLLESSPEAILLVDGDGRISVVNRQAEHLFGYPRDALPGRPLEILLPADIRARHAGHVRAFSAHPAIRTMGSGLELYGRRRDGSEFPAEVSLHPVKTPAGPLTMSTVRDISEHKRAEEALALKAEALARSNTELEQFAYVVSHDLQEPMRKVQAFGERLERGYADALGSTGRDYLARMRDASSRMQNLINDLLAYSRLSSLARPFAPVDLAEVTRGVIADLEVRILETRATVTIGGDLPVIEADSLQMRQLLQNLIGNALKYRRAEVPSRVTIHGGLVEEEQSPGPRGTGPALCRITVEDNGIGFDEMYAERIFAPFQRLHGRGEYEGTGIGLAICRKIAEHHRGGITVRSAPGRGTSFIVSLPVGQSEGRRGNE